MNPFETHHFQSQSQLNQVWGKFTSINPNLKDIQLTKPVITIGRGFANDIVINDIRLSDLHCVIMNNDDGTITIEDRSFNGTFIGTQKIGNHRSEILSSGEKFYILCSFDVPNEEWLGYIFSVIPNEFNLLKRSRFSQEIAPLFSGKMIKPENFTNYPVDAVAQNRNSPGYSGLSSQHICPSKHEIVTSTLDTGENQNFKSDPDLSVLKEDSNEYREINRQDYGYNFRGFSRIQESQNPLYNPSSGHREMEIGTNSNTVTPSEFDNNSKQDRKLAQYQRLFSKFTV